MKFQTSTIIAAGTYAFLFGLALGCPPTGPVVAPNDATDATSTPDGPLAACQVACDHLSQIGCVVQADCASVICRSNADPRFPHFDLGCIGLATAPRDVGICGISCVMRVP